MDPAAAKKRCQAATAEPWEVWEYEEDNYRGAPSLAVAVVMEWHSLENKPKAYPEKDSTVLTHPDAEFIAHARSDLPEALEALEAAAGLMEESVEALEEAQAEVKQLTIGFESLRQSLTVMEPNYENTKRDLREAQGKLEAVAEFADDHYKDGICLVCPDDGHTEPHSPAHGCWVKALDRILRGSKEE